MSPRAPRFRPGERIARNLTVMAAIDEGGPDALYVVWRDWRPMACKVFATRERARRETGILAALAHPNIVRLLGAGDRPPHLVMEYLEGPSLSRLLKTLPAGKLRIADALRVGIHVGAALSHMHGRGYLHCDVKPRNVIATAGRPILFDFGLARSRADWDKPLFEGTDPYMAPEQCRREPVSPATDVFGLGATLYELIAGAKPFPAATSRRAFPQLDTPATPLRDRRPGVSRALARIVHACLAPAAADRPALADLIPALHAHISGGAPMWPRDFDAAAAERPPARPEKPRRTQRKPARRPARPRLAAGREDGAAHHA